MLISGHDKEDGAMPQQEPEAGYAAAGPDASGPGSPKGKLRRLLGSPPVVTAIIAFLVIVMAGLSFSASAWKKKVKVTRAVASGNAIVSAGEIEARLKGFNGRLIDEVSDNEIRGALSPIPYIRELTVSRELNGIVRVRVVERRPVAVTLFQGRSMIVDAEGMLLPDNGTAGRFHRLPPVYGIGSALPYGRGLYRMPRQQWSLLERLLSAFSASEYAGLLLREIHLEPANGSWFAVSGSPVRFIVGNDGDFKEKLKKFEIFWQKVIAKKGLDCYESVDLRFRDRVFAMDPAAVLPPTAPADSSGVSPTPKAAPADTSKAL